MKYHNHLELILFPKYSLRDVHQKKLVGWLETIAQSVIQRQHEDAKKINLEILKEMPAIYMS
jgi:hypothetical protein